MPFETNTRPARSNFLCHRLPFAPAPICAVSSTSVNANDSCRPSFHPHRPNTLIQSLSGCSKFTPNPYLIVVCSGCALISLSHTSREKLDLVNRTKKVIGQLGSVLRALDEHDPCAEVLQRLSAA